MASSVATRIYGLEAIGAAAGSDEAQAFTRHLYERVADKDLAGASAEQRAAAALSLLAFAPRRPPRVGASGLAPGPPAGRRQGARVHPPRRRTRLREPPLDRTDRQRRHALPG